MEEGEGWFMHAVEKYVSSLTMLRSELQVLQYYLIRAPWSARDKKREHVA